MTDQLPARMFNTVGRALGDGWWLPLTQRKNIADALYALVRPELEQLRRCVPLICSDERHQAKIEALETERDRLRAALRKISAYCDLPLERCDCAASVARTALEADRG